MFRNTTEIVAMIYLPQYSSNYKYWPSNSDHLYIYSKKYCDDNCQYVKRKRCIMYLYIYIYTKDHIIYIYI